MMRRATLRLLGALSFMSFAPAAGADGSPSVQVETIMPVRGRLPDVVVAFGTAGPALDGTMTVSLQSQGRVSRFMVTAGEAVIAGQPLLDFAVSQAALGSFRQAETALSTARIERGRLEQLRVQQLATKDQVTQAEKAIADAQNQLDTLTRSGAGKADLTIKAPFDGVVSSIPIVQGDTVAPGAPMMTLMRADGLVVTVGIEPSARARVKRAAPATITPLTGGGPPVAGKVVRIDGLLNPKTHLVDADIATGAHLLPGAAFRASITVGDFSGFIVPRDSVSTDSSGAHCFQVVGGKARRVAVTVVGSNDESSVVVGPIAPAQPLVIVGNHQLADGMAVRVAPAASTGSP